MNEEKKKLQTTVSISSFAIFIILYASVIYLLYHGIVYHEISIPRHAYSAYLTTFDKEPKLFLFALTFLFIMLTILTSIFIKSFKFMKFNGYLVIFGLISILFIILVLIGNSN